LSFETEEYKFKLPRAYLQVKLQMVSVACLVSVSMQVAWIHCNFTLSERDRHHRSARAGQL